MDRHVELASKRPLLGATIFFGVVGIAILFIALAASALNVALNVGVPGIGNTFSSASETFRSWLLALLVFGIALLALNAIMKRVNSNIEAKKTASKNTESKNSKDETENTSS